MTECRRNLGAAYLHSTVLLRILLGTKGGLRRWSSHVGLLWLLLYLPEGERSSSMAVAVGLKGTRGGSTDGWVHGVSKHREGLN